MALAKNSAILAKANTTSIHIPPAKAGGY